MLKWVLQKCCGRGWNSFIWPRMGKSGGLLWQLYRTFWFHTVWGISWPAKERSASRGGLYCVEFVRSTPDIANTCKLWLREFCRIEGRRFLSPSCSCHRHVLVRGPAVSVWCSAHSVAVSVETLLLHKLHLLIRIQHRFILTQIVPLHVCYMFSLYWHAWRWSKCMPKHVVHI